MSTFNSKLHQQHITKFNSLTKDCKKTYTKKSCRKKWSVLPLGMTPFPIIFPYQIQAKMPTEVHAYVKQWTKFCYRQNKKNCKKPCIYIGLRGMPGAGCTWYEPQLPNVPIWTIRQVFDGVYSVMLIKMIAIVAERVIRNKNQRIASEHDLTKGIEIATNQIIAQREGKISRKSAKAVAAITTALVFAIIGSSEEFIFRDFLMDESIINKYSNKFAKLFPKKFDYVRINLLCIALISSLLFSLIHLVNFRKGHFNTTLIQLIFTFCMGMIAFTLRKRYHNLPFVIIMHFTFNAFSIFGGFYGLGPWMHKQVDKARDKVWGKTVSKPEEDEGS